MRRNSRQSIIKWLYLYQLLKAKWVFIYLTITFSTWIQVLWGVVDLLRAVASRLIVTLWAGDVQSNTERSLVLDLPPKASLCHCEYIESILLISQHMYIWNLQTVNCYIRITPKAHIVIFVFACIYKSKIKVSQTKYPS